MVKKYLLLSLMIICISSIFAFNTTLNETNNTILIEEELLTNESDSITEDINPYKNKETKEIKFIDLKYKPDKGINEKVKLKTQNLKKDETMYAIIQFNRNPSKEELNELKKEGIELSDYISSYSWYVRISQDLDTIFENNIEGDILLKNKKFKDKFVVRSIDSIKPEFKLSSHLRNNQIGDWAKDDGDNVYLTVQFHDGVTLDEAEKLMKDKGIEVVSRLHSINALTIKVYGGES